MRLIGIFISGDTKGLKVDFHVFNAIDHPTKAFTKTKYWLNSTKDRDLSRVIDKDIVGKINNFDVNTTDFTVESSAFVLLSDNKLESLLAITNMVDEMHTRIKNKVGDRIESIKEFYHEVSDGFTYRPPEL